MDSDNYYFLQKKEQAKNLYSKQNSIYSPFFKKEIILNSDGFHHLQFSQRHERTKREQSLKFNCLSFGLEIIRKSATIQEYRTGLFPFGKKSLRDGSVAMKNIEYWGMIAILGEHKVKIRVVLRRVGDGNITFWSVMP